MRRERHNEPVIRDVITRLRYLRRKNGLSQMDVYIDTDINIARIEAGRGNISLSTLADLCDYYQISLADFFGMDLSQNPVSPPEKLRNYPVHNRF